jgi:hypothetical protein
MGIMVPDGFLETSENATLGASQLELGFSPSPTLWNDKTPEIS